MTTTVSTLVEIGALARTRPGLHATANEIAAWYEQKALLLHHIGESGYPNAEQHSHRAHTHAQALLGGGGRHG